MGFQWAHVSWSSGMSHTVPKPGSISRKYWTSALKPRVKRLKRGERWSVKADYLKFPEVTLGLTNINIYITNAREFWQKSMKQCLQNGRKPTSVQLLKQRLMSIAHSNWVDCSRFCPVVLKYFKSSKYL